MKILVYSVCDYEKLPNGGEVMLLNNFLSANSSSKNNYYLVGMTFDKKDEVGKWQKKKIGNKTYDFFPVCKVLKDKEKTHIPFRLKVMLGIAFYWKKINAIDADYHYIHEAELAIPMWNKKIDIVYHGHGDPCQTLKISRFPIFRLKVFSDIYWKIIAVTLKKSCKLIWAADRSRELYIKQQPKMKEMVESKSCTVHSSFDTKMVPDNRLKLDSKKKHIVTVGRLSRVKRIDFLLQVVAAIAREEKDIDFIICGDGEDKKELMDLSNRLGVADKVVFLGLCDRKQIATALKESEVFVFASENEAMSLVVLESLYMGTPVVSTNVGDIAYAVHNGKTGYLVNDYDLSLYVDSVKRVLELGKGYFSENCKVMAKNFTPDKMAQGINEVFDEIEANKNKNSNIQI